MCGADGDAEEGDDDGYENDIDNDLEDGFSMVAGEEGDGFDPDVVRAFTSVEPAMISGSCTLPTTLAMQDVRGSCLICAFSRRRKTMQGRLRAEAMPSSRDASRRGYVGHRNYDSLSSRSPRRYRRGGLPPLAMVQY